MLAFLRGSAQQLPSNIQLGAWLAIKRLASLSFPFHFSLSPCVPSFPPLFFCFFSLLKLPCHAPNKLHFILDPPSYGWYLRVGWVSMSPLRHPLLLHHTVFYKTLSVSVWGICRWLENIQGVDESWDDMWWAWIVLLRKAAVLLLPEHTCLLTHPLHTNHQSQPANSNFSLSIRWDLFFGKISCMLTVSLIVNLGNINFIYWEYSEKLEWYHTISEGWVLMHMLKNLLL